jgi:uncharacterized protein YdaU (DUF1376 family)
MADYPAMPLFTDAYLADTTHLTDAEHGLYLRLLMIMWRSPGCRIPNEPQWIARRLNKTMEEYDLLVRPIVDEFLISSGNWLTQKRLSKEYDFVRGYSKKQSDRAKSRWNKEKSACQTDERHQSGIPSGNAPTPTPTPTEVSNDTSYIRPYKRDAATEEAVTKAWNILADELQLAKVQRLTEARASKLGGRLKEIGGLEGWYVCLDKVRQSKFLTGGSSEWRVSFDWLLSPQNITKVMEGNYDDRKRQGTSGTRSRQQQIADDIADERARILAGTDDPD